MVARIADEKRAGSEAGSQARQAHAVRRTANDAVEDDDVGGRSGVLSIEHVCDAERTTTIDARIARQPPRVRLVGSDELDDLSFGRTGLQQLGLNGPDASANLEDAGII